MYANVLSRERIDLLARLNGNNILQGLYLAGGSGAGQEIFEPKVFALPHFS